MDKKRVLVFPAGAENALEIYDSIKYNVNVEVFGLSGKKDYAEFVYDDDHYIEGDYYLTNKDFDEHFIKVLVNRKIDVIIPTHDDVAVYLAHNKEKYPCKVLVSDEETTNVCRNKTRMYELIRDEWFCPKYSTDPNIFAETEYPIFAKPDVGSGAVGAKKIDSKEILDSMLYENGEYVFCEYLPGEELTVDCFTDRHGILRFIGPRSRDRIQMGIAFRSTTVPVTNEIKEIAESINKRLSFFGAWYYQIKRDSGGVFKLLEISCRQSVTMTLYRHMGINFPMLGIFELFGVDTSYVLCKEQCQIERRLHTSFKLDILFSTVYIDLDDTIIVDNKVCDVVIRFLYQCVNEGKQIILLTRHEGELDEILDKHRINKSLFDDIIHITFDNMKTDYISPSDAIFIDNSYSERKLISDKYDIPVFDVDAVDMLVR